tara:strand:- start:1557 stop:1727 length:171 start_codon:yes stop_codon:yes gene_type:complete
MKKIIILIFITACASQKEIPQDKKNFLPFQKNLTFNEFKTYLKKYVEISPYPDIDD